MRLNRYLATAGIIGSDGTGTGAERSASVLLSEEYAKHLREVRGFAPSTVGHHRYASQCFLNHLKTKRVPLGSIQPKSESNNKLDKCLRRAYSKVDDQVHARAVCFGSGKAMAEGVPHLE